MNTQQNTTGNAVTERQQAINKRRYELNKQFKIQPEDSIEGSKERIAKVREELAKLDALEKSNKEIPFESLDSKSVIDYTAKVQKDFTESGEWASAARAAKSLRGITPRYESELNHFLQSKYTVNDLEKERIEAIRELQDYGIKVNKTMTFAEINREVNDVINKEKLFGLAGVSRNSMQVDAIRDRVRALNAAEGVKTAESAKAERLAKESQQTIGGWTYLVSAGYYLTFFAPKSLPLLYSIHNGKTSCRVICRRNAPAAAATEGGTCFNFATAKTIDKAEFNQILSNKPSWTQLGLAYDLQLPLLVTTELNEVRLRIELDRLGKETEQYKFNFENANIVF